MNSKSKIIFGLATLTLIICLGLRFSSQINQELLAVERASHQLATVILTHSFKSVGDLKTRYDLALANPANKKVRVLIVPGHEPNYGGAEYGNLKERVLVEQLAQDLKRFLQNNPHFEVFVTRDSQTWSPDLANYFQNHWAEIVEWRQASRNETNQLIALGSMPPLQAQVSHSRAKADVATRLWGITKWANENNIDVTIHLHLNDYARPATGQPGRYSGLAIYVPTSQYGNSPTTKAVAQNIFNRLAKYNSVSDLSGERTGLVEEPDLIAIGAKNSSNAASLLIEYGYIYEPQFTNPQLRELALKDLAYQTYLGLQDFFEPNSAVRLTKTDDTLLLPHDWQPTKSGNETPTKDIFALQTALMLEGEYPPAGKNKNDCPRTGVLGPCTKSALLAFQTKKGINGENGLVGEKTLTVLKQLY
ncbi:MAG: N-acetylmuramoyl-L-alanine amidase [Candidatus Paceibacterota bacterium]